MHNPSLHNASEKPVSQEIDRTHTHEIADNLGSNDISNKLASIESVVGVEQAKNFKQALDICDLEAKGSIDTEVAEKWLGIKNKLLTEVSYEKIHGKNCIIIPVLPKPWCIEDATAIDFKEKFGLDVCPSTSDGRRFYSMTGTGLDKIPLDKRKIHIPDDETYKILIKWLNNDLPRDRTKNSFLADGYTGKILEKICNLGYPGMYGSFAVGGFGQGSEEKTVLVGFNGEIMSADATPIMGHYHTLDYNNKGDLRVSEVVSHIKPLVRFYE